MPITDRIAASLATVQDLLDAIAEVETLLSLTTLDNFGTRYIGRGTPLPTTNGGSPLEARQLFYLDGTGLHSWDGAAWVQISTAVGLLEDHLNLSDVANVATARASLGLGTAALSAVADTAFLSLDGRVIYVMGNATNLTLSTVSTLTPHPWASRFSKPCTS